MGDLWVEDPVGLDAAEQLALDAARRSGVSVRELSSPVEHLAAEGLLARIWNTGAGRPPMSRDLMRAIAWSGGYVAGAYLGNDLVGVSVAFLTAGGAKGSAALADDSAVPRLDGEDATVAPVRLVPGMAVQLHSHLAGAAPESAGRRVGTALKLHQRAWALARGIEAITWTFDPLVRRNAYFNLTKLGAEATQYLSDFYGDMDDGINAGQGSDRLAVRWDLRRPPGPPVRAVPADAPALIAAGQVVLGASPDGLPAPASVSDPTGPWLCLVPEDIEDLRRRDPGAARQWRLAVRAVMAPALTGGRQIASFDRAGWYLMVSRQTEERS
jgi:predicted GNAT superfamily acetyltransferase